jgi:hypothetical protein
MSLAMRAAPVRTFPLLLVVAASAGCLAAAYGIAGQWLGAVLVIAPGLLLAFHRKLRAAWVPPVFLCGMITAAAAGTFLGAPAYLLISGTVLALAAWDLACFQRIIRRSGSPEAVGTLRNRHARALVRAVGLGLLFGVGGSALTLRIPFALMLLLVIADLVCLGLALRLLSRQRGRGIRGPGRRSA